jgi:predicted ATPase
MSLLGKPFLTDVTLLKNQVPSYDVYPFTIPAIRHLENLPLHSKITFFVGENGSGKSTLIEALAVALDFNVEGGNKNTRFTTRATHSDLSQYLRLSRGVRRPKDGYFLRAESFYNVASYMDEIGFLDGYGGQSLHAQSHGESFIALLNNKLRGNGLYLMDEPEAALSPSRQLSALAIIHQLVKANSQFIMATHSPILMAYPDAAIYLLSESGIQRIEYKETEHYAITKAFINNTEKMLEDILE